MYNPVNSKYTSLEFTGTTKLEFTGTTTLLGCIDVFNLTFFKYKHYIFANKYSILNIPSFIQYSKHKNQTVQGNSALIFSTFGFFRLSFYLKNFECEKVGKFFLSCCCEQSINSQ